MIDAAANGDNAKLLELLAAGANIDAQTGMMNGEFQESSMIFVGVWGGSPLIVAAGKGHLETTRLLLDKGANVNAKDSDGGSALLYAARGGYIEVIRLLLKHGANPNAKNTQDKTPLYDAVGYGHLEAVNLLLDGGADINGRGYRESTALIESISLKRVDITKTLLDRGADVHIKDHLSGTALIAAVERDLPDLVRLLIARGANVNAYGDNGWTPLQCILPGTRLEIMQLLKQAGAREYGWTDLMYAVHEGKIEKVQLLLKQGAKVNETGALGETALTRAIGHPAILKLLIQCGANVNIVHNRETDLDTALAMGQIDCVEILLDHGANPNVKSVFLQTPLMEAVQYPEAIEQLIEKGANVNARDRDGKTALDYAIAAGRSKTVELLKEAGAK